MQVPDRTRSDSSARVRAVHPPGLATPVWPSLSGRTRGAPTMTRTIARIALLAGLIALAGCEHKETGPEEQDTRTTAPVVAAPAPAVTAVPPTVHPLSDFATLDANHDGRIASAEYARAAQSLFEMIDMEHDGTVTLQELEAARGVLGDLDGLDPKRILALADADQDGKLTLGEWMAFNNARFDRIDANDDGFIDRAEWNAPHPAPPEPSAIP
ncbi:hypothetical protein F1640_09830 [Novosphingobium sp. NBM11]|nr:hypothetical protein [Novosphingobium sp. NBM11]